MSSDLIKIKVVFPKHFLTNHVSSNTNIRTLPKKTTNTRAPDLRKSGKDLTESTIIQREVNTH